MIQIRINIHPEALLHGVRDMPVSARLFGCLGGLHIAVSRHVPALAFPAHCLALPHLVRVRSEQRWKLLLETRTCLAQQHAILRTLRSGDTRLDLSQIE